MTLLTEGEATDQVTRDPSARFFKDRLHSFQNKMPLVSLMGAEPADGWLWSAGFEPEGRKGRVKNMHPTCSYDDARANT